MNERLLAALLADDGRRISRLVEFARESGGVDLFLVHGHPRLSRREACRLKALVRLLAKDARARAPRPRLLDRPSVEAWARRALGPLLHEELWVIALDAGLRVRGVRLLARGTGNRLLLSPRDCLEEVVRLRGKAFVLLHNHPSGEARASAEDIEFTRAILSAGAILGLPLVDHLIVTDDATTSIVEEGRLASPGR